MKAIRSVQKTIFTLSLAMTWLCPTGLAQEPTVAASRAETTGSVTYTIQAKQSQLVALMRIDTAGPLYAVMTSSYKLINPPGPSSGILEDVGSCKVNLLPSDLAPSRSWRFQSEIQVKRSDVRIW